MNFQKDWILGAKLLERLKLPESFEFAPFSGPKLDRVIRVSFFDACDEDGHPFKTLIFVIELSTGKYVNEPAHGHKFGIKLQ